MKKLTQAAQAAKAIKSELKTAFPDINFSVKSDNYSMGDAVRISYTDGVPAKDVEAIVNKYQYGNFDSMTDMYENTNSRTDLPQAKYVQVSREMSEAAKDELLDFVQKHYGCDHLGYLDYFESMREYVYTLVRRVFVIKYYSVPANAVYKIEISSNHQCLPETKYFTELPKNVEYMEGFQNPTDAGKACLLVWDNGTTVTPLIEVSTGKPYYKK